MTRPVLFAANKAAVLCSGYCVIVAGAQFLPVPKPLSVDSGLGLISCTACPLQVDVAGPEVVVGPGPTPASVAETEYGGHIVRAGHKRYFFDPGSNQKGNFVRITEVGKPSSPCVRLPDRAKPAMYQKLCDIAQAQAVALCRFAVRGTAKMLRSWSAGSWCRCSLQIGTPTLVRGQGL